MLKFAITILLLLGISLHSRCAENNIDIVHSKLNLHFDWSKKQVKGVATIKFILLNTGNHIQLDAGFLTIHSIQLSDKTNLKFVYDGQDSKLGLFIHLDKTYSAGAEIEISIDYHSNFVNESDPNNLGGSYGKGIRFIQPTKSNPIKRKQLWSNGEPEGNKYWYPCVESLTDRRTTELIATVDSNLTVLSNGQLIASTIQSKGTRTFHYVSEDAYPNYLTNIIIGEYAVVEQNYKNIPLFTFCYPDEKEAATASANRLSAMVAYFSEYTGASYPYSSYSQVMVQDYPFPGLTGQNMVSTISDNFVDDERTHKDFLYLWDGIEAEALAAQWFGNLVSVKNWNHSWLTKALAHFLEGKFGEQANGHEEYLMWYQSFDMDATLADWNSGNQHPLVVENITDLTNFLTADNYLRSRGTLVLRMLEMEIGKEKFQKAIQYFIKKNAHKTVTTQDFQMAIEQLAKRKMDWFFDQWIYKMGQPVFEVTKRYNPSEKILELKFVQTQKPDSTSDYPQVNYFQGTMQLEIDDKLHSIYLKPIEENTFEIPLPSAPNFVNVNYEKTWIAEISMQKSLQEYLFQFETSKDLLARMNAMYELAALYKDPLTASQDKKDIYTSMLNVVSNKEYWRFRMPLLSTLDGMLTKPFDTEMKTVLLTIIQQEESLLKANAIRVLGNETNSSNAALFIQCLNDQSDRVIFNAAIALGKTKSPDAFEALSALINKASWKGQSKMAALSGMIFLGDERAVPIALAMLKDNTSPRWFLGASGWDYPVYAATALASFKKGNLGYEIILDRFNLAMQENDINDIFSNVLLISILADPRGQEVFERLKIKFKDDSNALNAATSYEEQFNDALQK